MYVTPEWHQSDTGMREYHAMFLEQLTVEDLKKKLAKKCCIEESNIVAVLKYEILWKCFVLLNLLILSDGKANFTETTYLFVLGFYDFPALLQIQISTAQIKNTSQ